MKKITLLLSFIACVGFMQAQTNLLVNPSFETWTGGFPDSWTVPSNSAHASAITCTKETGITKDGASAMRLVIDGTQNPGFSQLVPITVGKTYTVSVSYYVVAGDGSDVRIWSSFKNGDSYWASTDWTGNTALQTLLQGSGTSTSAYFTIDNGTWGTYTTDFVAPANATEFSLECRTYKNSTVIWDNFFFGLKVSANVNNTNANKFTAVVSGRNLLVKGVQEGANVEIYSALGSKVLSAAVVNGKIDMSSVSKGLYVVRVNKETQKILF